MAGDVRDDWIKHENATQGCRDNMTSQSGMEGSWNEIVKIKK